MQRYEPKPWDVRYCSMVRDEQGEYVRYDDAQATIARLTAELAQARAEAAAVRFSREHHKDRANRAKERMGNLRKRKAALMSALNEVLASNDLANAKFTASVALGGWEDDVILYRARSLSTEPGTTALAEIVKKAVDAETRACAEVCNRLVHAKQQRHGYKTAWGAMGCREAILSRIDQRKEAGE